MSAEVCVRGEFQATQYDVSEFSEGKLTDVVLQFCLSYVLFGWSVLNDFVKF
jgi:hypothetical protein